MEPRESTGERLIYEVWASGLRREQCRANGMADAAQAYAKRHGLQPGASIRARIVTPEPPPTLYTVGPDGWVEWQRRER